VNHEFVTWMTAASTAPESIAEDIGLMFCAATPQLTPLPVVQWPAV